MALATSMRSPNSWVTQAHVRRLTAAGAGTRELKQRFEQLGVLDQVGRDLFARDERQAEEVIPVFRFAFNNWRLSTHVDGMPFGVGLVFSWAVLNAQTAADTIFRSNLDSPGVAIFPLAEFGSGGFEGLGGIFEQLVG